MLEHDQELWKGKHYCQCQSTNSPAFTKPFLLLPNPMQQRWVDLDSQSQTVCVYTNT